MTFKLTRDMIVVENDDPRVFYSQGWEQIPGEAAFCTSGSFHRTYTEGAIARFEFEGSYIWLIGHKSASHGIIKINIDGQPGIATINAWGNARAPTPFQTLFKHEFAEAGAHWIEVVSDLGGAEITIDAFAYRPLAPGRPWRVPLGMKLVTMAENDPRIEYSGKWQQYYDNLNSGHLGCGTCYVTYARNATACVSFESAHFWIIGDMYHDRGRYSVSVDGGLFETFSSYEPSWRGFVVKYERQFPIPGPHRIVIRNEEDKGFCLDAVMYETCIHPSYEVPVHPASATARPTTLPAQNVEETSSGQTEGAA